MTKPRSALWTLADLLEQEHAQIAGLTNGMPSEVATPYFERIDALMAEYEALIGSRKRLRAALEDVLDAAERARAGFAIESEEWYARRDFARVVLEDTK